MMIWMVLTAHDDGIHNYGSLQHLHISESLPEVTFLLLLCNLFPGGGGISEQLELSLTVSRLRFVCINTGL